MFVQKALLGMLLQHVTVCCSVLQCVAVCCSVLQCVADFAFRLILTCGQKAFFGYAVCCVVVWCSVV